MARAIPLTIGVSLPGFLEPAMFRAIARISSARQGPPTSSIAIGTKMRVASTAAAPIPRCVQVGKSRCGSMRRGAASRSGPSIGGGAGGSAGAGPKCGSRRCLSVMDGLDHRLRRDRQREAPFAPTSLVVGGRAGGSARRRGRGCPGIRDFLEGEWRRGWDSNPRKGLSPFNGLANRRLRPLGHPSAGVESHTALQAPLLAAAPGAVKPRSADSQPPR